MPTNINDKLISWARRSTQTIRQAEKAARLPIVEGHVALMPDAHVGIGATVGSVIPTRGAVIPSAVGVDIGCGMIAAELDVTEDQLPDTLEPLLGRIEQVIPAGVGQGPRPGGPGRRPVARRAPAGHRAGRRQGDQGGQAVRHPGVGQPLLRAVHRRAAAGVGRAALGQPGHRQPAGPGPHRQGPQTGQGRRARGSRTRTWRTSSRAPPEFTAYIGDMLWAQDYARANRDQMMDNAMREVFAFLGFGRETERINCHHNFTQREVHGGEELWITRKGAIKADRGDLGVIPGSMGTRSYIVAGKGNPDSWTSCSHGAGRRHTRTQAKKLFTTADLAAADGRQGLAVAAGRPAGGRDPGRLQGHRPGHGRPGRPGRGPPHAAPGPQLQGHLRRRPRAPARNGPGGGPMRGGGTGTTPGPEPGGPRSSRGLAAHDASAVVTHLDSRVGLLRRRGFLRLKSGWLRVRVPSPHFLGCSSTGRAPVSSAAWFPGRPDHPGQLRRTGFLQLA